MAHESKGLPGLRGTDHIGITAPDFDEAADFLENVLGLVPFYQMGPFGSDDSDWMKDLLNVHPRAVIRRVRHYRGGHHITLYVDDIDAAMDHLRAHDVRLMNGGGPPVAEGPEAGLRSCYFLTPWDLQMELISYPNGKGYQQDTDDRLWDPRNPGA